MANVYSDDQITAALAALELNGGRIRGTARELGIPAPTLLSWRDQAIAGGATGLNAPVRVNRDFTELWAQKEAMVLELIGDKAPNASFRDLSIFAGIAADKHLNYRDGRPGATLNVDARSQTLIGSDALIAAILRARQAPQVESQRADLLPDQAQEHVDT